MAKPLWRSCPWGPSAKIRNKHGEKPRAGRFNIGVNGIFRCNKCRVNRYSLAEILRIIHQSKARIFSFMVM